MNESIITIVAISALGISGVTTGSDSFSTLDGVNADPMDTEAMDAVQGRGGSLQGSSWTYDSLNSSYINSSYYNSVYYGWYGYGPYGYSSYGY